MRRFELSEGSSNKFWQIELQGKGFTVNYGRIGTNGQTQTKAFDTEAKAKAEHDKLVSEKTKKGYAEVQASGSLAAVAVKPPAEKKETEEVEAPAPVVTKAPEPAPVSRALVVSTEPHIAWTPRALAECGPTSRSDLVKADLPTAAASWKRIRKSVDELASIISLGHNEALTRRVQAAYGTETPNEEKDVTLHAGAWALYARPKGYYDSSNDAPFAAFLTRQFGLEFMLQCFAEAPAVTAGYNTRHFGNEGSPLMHDTWRALSMAWLASPEAERNKALPQVKKWIAGGIDAQRQIALAMMSDDDASVLRIAATLQNVNHQHHRFALEAASCLRAPDVATAKQCLTLGADWQWYTARQFLELRHDLLLRFGLALEPLIIEVLEAAMKLGMGAEFTRDLSATLSLIVSPGVAEYFASHLGVKDLRAAAAEYLGAYPQLAIAAVADLAVGRGAAAEPARALFRGFVATQPQLVKEFEAGAAPAVKALIAEVEAANDVVDAPDDLLPAGLRDVPWKRKTKAVAAPVVKDVSIPQEPMSLRAQLRAQLKSEGGTHYESSDKVTAKLLAAAKGEKTGNWGDRYSSSLFLQVPKKEAVETFNTAELGNFGWSYYPVATSMLDRHELEVVPGLLNLVDVSIVDAIDALYFVDGSAPAVAMAKALKSKKQRAKAQTWLLRQPKAAAAGLIPTAIGPTGAVRSSAEDALRFLSANGQREVIEDIAQKAGVLEAVQAVLDFDALLLLPKKLPALPAFFTPGSFTRPRLKDKKHALPLATLETLGTMLAISSVDAPYAGVLEVKEVTDPRSLAQFSWDVFQAWNAAGAPSKEGWAFQQLGLLGDDEVARLITPLIRQWPGEAQHARAVTGLDVLARIGSDVALMHLHGIAQKVKFKGLQEKAREKISQVAEQRGFTADELADRLVPDLGLDDDGTLWLDFGPRKFKVVFDETLKPFVLADGAGKPIDLPKPRQSDDAEKAAAAVDQWKAMKKDARTIAEGQVRRLELAMCSQRRWDRDVFEKFLLEHPLMIHLVRRLVWGVYDKNDTLLATFRAAEDRSLADAKDDTYELPETARIGVVHRLDLDEATAGQWGQVFADYELLQPFEQLSRAAFELGDLANAKELDRVKDLDIPTGKVLGLDKNGWRRGPPQDGGVTCWYEKKTSAGIVSLDLDPGIFTGMLSESPRQKLGRVYLATDGGWWAQDRILPFGKLSRVEASELLRDLDSLKET
ncbi:MAG: WGR and DUF4132 domain-containing protein [Archangium sp.]